MFRSISIDSHMDVVCDGMFEKHQEGVLLVDVLTDDKHQEYLSSSKFEWSGNEFQSIERALLGLLLKPGIKLAIYRD